MWARCRFLTTAIDGSNPGCNVMLCPSTIHLVHIASVESAVKQELDGKIFLKRVCSVL